MNSVFSWPVGRVRGQRECDPAPLGPVLVYVTTCALGGATNGLMLAQVGAVARALGHGTSRTAYLLGAAVVVVAAGLELAGRFAPLPQRHAQVPRRWLIWRHSSLLAGGYGFLLGLGWVTYLQHATAYCVFCLIALAPSVQVGVWIGAAYGFARGAMLLITWCGDRWLGRRPDWINVARHRRLLGGVLTAAALMTYGTVAIT